MSTPFNFFPTKAEEEAAAGAGSSSRQNAVSSSEANKWTLTKAILSIDVDTKGKLVLPKGFCGTDVENNIIRYLHPDIARAALAGKEGMIKMKDVDTGKIIGNMIISKEQNQFYIKGHWKKEFVQRRGLQVGDEIGLRWNVQEHYLEFSKLDY